MTALYKGFVVTAISSLIVLYPITDYVLGLNNTYNIGEKEFTGLSLYYCGVIGLSYNRINYLGYRILYRNWL